MAHPATAKDLQQDEAIHEILDSLEQQDKTIDKIEEQIGQMQSAIQIAFGGIQDEIDASKRAMDIVVAKLGYLESTVTALAGAVDAVAAGKEQP